MSELSVCMAGLTSENNLRLYGIIARAQTFGDLGGTWLVLLSTLH